MPESTNLKPRNLISQAILSKIVSTPASITQTQGQKNFS